MKEAMVEVFAEVLVVKQRRVALARRYSPAATKKPAAPHDADIVMRATSLFARVQPTPLRYPFGVPVFVDNAIIKPRGS